MILYGKGYGGYVVNTLLQLLEKEKSIVVTGVIYDGMVPPDIAQYSMNDFYINEAATSLLEECVERSPSCRDAFGVVPKNELNVLWNQLLHGKSSCLGELDNIDAIELRRRYTELLFTNDIILVPAILKRLDFCTEKDVKELNHWLKNYKPEKSQVNRLLYHHIAFSELFSTTSNINWNSDHYIFARYTNFTFEALAEWPTYTPDEKYHRKWSSHKASTLFIHRENNFNSNLMYTVYAANELAPRMDNVGLVRVPYEVNDKSNQANCYEKVVADFVKTNRFNENPCLKQTTGPDFEGDKASSTQLSKLAFGVSSLWGESKADGGVPEYMTWEGYVLFSVYLVLVVIVAAVFILLVVKSTRRPDQTRGANYYFNENQ